MATILYSSDSSMDDSSTSDFGEEKDFPDYIFQSFPHYSSYPLEAMGIADDKEFKKYFFKETGLRIKKISTVTPVTFNLDESELQEFKNRFPGSTDFTTN